MTDKWITTSCLTVNGRNNNSQRVIFQRRHDMVCFENSGRGSRIIWSVTNDPIPCFNRFLNAELVWRTQNTLAVNVKMMS